MTLTYPSVAQPPANIRTLIADQIVGHAAENNAHVVYVLTFIAREAGITNAEIEEAIPGSWSLEELRLATNKGDFHRSRAKKYRLKEHFSAFDWLKIVDAAGHRCEICGCTDRPLTVEHKQPLGEGGSNKAENIAATCEGCNAARDLVGDDYLMKITGWKGF